MQQENTDWPPGASIETFGLNLRALMNVQPELGERLCWSVNGDHLREEANGQITYSWRGSWVPIALGESDVEFEIESALARVGEDARVLVFGIGLAEYVDRLLARDGTRLVVWDRDPWMMRVLLGRRDYSDMIASGRLRVALGADLLRLQGDPTIEARIEHPLFREIYSRELEWLESGAREKRALLCEGELYVDSLANALQDEGYSVWMASVERLSSEELDYTVQVLEPQLMAAVNYRLGLVEFTHRHGIELLTWEIDPFTHQPSAPQTPSSHARIFSYRKKLATDLSSLGFENVEYLPLAADTKPRQPGPLSESEREHYSAPISFVGSSMLANASGYIQQFCTDFGRFAAETGAVQNVQTVLEELLTEQRGLLDQWVVDGALERLAPGFTDWSRDVIGERDPAALVGELVAAERRLTMVANLADFGIQVWGDSGWSQIATSGANYRGSAKHGHDLTRIYRASTINLDIGRLYQNDIVTMRVFDILACGGFAIVEHTDALEELFEVGVELESYRDRAECREKVRHYFAHPEEARAIAERGLQAVRQRHSFEHRVRQMLAAFEGASAHSAFGLAG